MNLLLCYPRSGSTFTRYIIEALTGVGSLGPPYSRSVVDLPLLHPRKTVASPVSVIRIHREDTKSRQVASLVEKKGFPLILLIRDPIESICRHRGTITAQTVVNYPYTEICPTVSYFLDNLEFYENYPHKKMVIYYEDLVLNPRKYVSKLAQFLEIEDVENKVNHFMAEYETHKSSGLNMYNSTQAGTLTRGNDPNKNLHLVHGSQTQGNVTKKHSLELSSEFKRVFWKNFTSILTPQASKLIEHYIE